MQVMAALEMAIHEIDERLVPTHDLDQSKWVVLMSVNETSLGSKRSRG